MSDDNHERELAALFDKTAQTPSAPVLTKLSARAADVPARARRWPSAAWLALPALVGAVGVIAVLLTRHGPPSPSASTQPAHIARTTELVPTVPSARPSPSTTPQAVAEAESSAPAPQLEPSTDDAVGDDDIGLDLDDASESDDALASATAVDPDFSGYGEDDDALDGPSSDADLDVWLRATSELLEEGG